MGLWVLQDSEYTALILLFKQVSFAVFNWSVSWATLNCLCQFYPPTIGTNRPFCVNVPLNTKQTSIDFIGFIGCQFINSSCIQHALAQNIFGEAIITALILWQGIRTFLSFQKSAIL